MGYFKDDYPYKCAVAICDDGSTKQPIPEDFRGNPGWLSLYWLPPKLEWKCPTEPLNLLVEKSRSPILLLQSPETYHIVPIIEAICNNMKTYKDVILVSVKRQKDNYWLSHPIRHNNSLWFCQAISYQFYREIGGMDDAFRDGYGGEDNDFAIRLRNAGAKYKWLNPDRFHVVMEAHRKEGITREEANERHSKITMHLLNKRYGRDNVSKIRGFNEIVE